MRRSSGDRVRVAGLAVAGCLLVISSAWAQAPDDAALAAARQLGQDGVTLYNQGDAVGAGEKLERAYAVVKVPTLGLWSARALEKQGKLVQALQRYREVTLLSVDASAPEVLRAAQSEAQAGYDALAPNIPQLTVQLRGATSSEVSVTVDGHLVPAALVGAAMPADPGTRSVQGQRGQSVVTKTVTLAPGERRTLDLVFEEGTAVDATSASDTVPRRAAPPSGGGDKTIVPWLVVAGGGAVAITGGVFIALALSAKSNVESGTRLSDVKSDFDNVPTYSTAGLVLVGVGVAAVAAGLVWEYSLSDGEHVAVSVQASASHIALTGTF